MFPPWCVQDVNIFIENISDEVCLGFPILAKETTGKRWSEGGKLIYDGVCSRLSLSLRR
jgi:hypothetical protein